MDDGFKYTMIAVIVLLVLIFFFYGYACFIYGT